MDKLSNNKAAKIIIYCIFLLLLVFLWLWIKHEPAPPTPMPYHTTVNETVTVLHYKYSMSRFWPCGWNGNCPQKRWQYCLQIIPENEDAAIAWYRRYYKDELLSILLSDKEEIDEIRAFSDDNPPHPPANMSAMEQETWKRDIQYKKKQKEFLRVIELIQSNDEGFKKEIFASSQEGFTFITFYSINWAGKPQESSTGWLMNPECY